MFKVLFGSASMDIISLRRDFDFEIIGAIDVQEALHILEPSQCNRIGFKKAVKDLIGYDIDKEGQNYDWRKRPLTAKMLKYARDDSHLLLRLWNIVRSKVKLYA